MLASDLAFYVREGQHAGHDPYEYLQVLDATRRELLRTIMERDGLDGVPYIPEHRWNQDYSCDHRWEPIARRNGREYVECSKPNCSATNAWPVAGADH